MSGSTTSSLPSDAGEISEARRESLEPTAVAWMGVDPTAARPKRRLPELQPAAPEGSRSRRIGLIGLILVVGAAGAYALGRGDRPAKSPDEPAPISEEATSAIPKPAQLADQERRLAALEQEIKTLEGRKERQQRELQTVQDRRTALIDELTELENQRIERVGTLEAGPDPETKRADLERREAEVARREAEVASREQQQKVRVETVSKLEAEEKARAESLAKLEQRKERAREELREVEAKRNAAERRLAALSGPEGAPAQAERRRLLPIPQVTPRAQYAEGGAEPRNPLPPAVRDTAPAEPRQAEERSRGLFSAFAGRPARSRVFVHYSTLEPNSREMAIRVARRLAARGFNVAEIRAVSVPLGGSSVRFFYNQDGTVAPRLSAALADALNAQGASSAGVRLHDFRNYSRPPTEGTLEVWVSRNRT
jgi:hypothetical protein